jgi:hypothetical protein
MNKVFPRNIQIMGKLCLFQAAMIRIFTEQILRDQLPRPDKLMDDSASFLS